MFAKLAFALLLIATPALAQEPQQIIAMGTEDAETCATGCQMITKEAVRAIAYRLHQLEEKNARLAEELAKKPNPKFCL